MIKIKQIVTTVLIAGVTLLGNVIAPTASVFADEASSDEKPSIVMQVSPVSNRVLLNAGAELTYLFNVDNNGNEDFKFKVYAAPYRIKDDAYNVDFNTEGERTQLSRWLSFRQNKSEDEFKSEILLELAKGERKTIEYKIKVPDSIPSGGQYAAIVVEYAPDSESGGSGVKTIPRINILVYGSTTGDTIEAGEITQHDMPGFLTDGKITVNSVVENKGNTDFAVDYNLTVDDIFGNNKYEKEVSYDVLPDTSRQIEMEWPDTPGFGIFRVTSTISIANLDQENEVSKIVLKLPLFIIIIMVIVLTALIIWIIILIRKRQARKSRVIV